MYITQILQYLLWPALIIISWLIIKNVLASFEKKFPENEEISDK
jgi:hypothetical protein